MGKIAIEDIDDRIVAQIELQAQNSGHSFEEEVREILERGACPSLAPDDRKTRVAEAERLCAITKRYDPETDSATVIRAMRDAGRSDEPPLTPEERVALFRRAQAMTPKGVQQTDSADIIRELRDRGYAGR